ncbi:MAG: hypothetical protein ACK50E_01950 [Bacteroidota bacterium]
MKHFVTSLLIGIVTLSNVQAQTAAELKAEREQLVVELKSKEYLNREEKLVKLSDKTPGETGTQSIDGLANTSTGVLGTLKANNDILAKYKREVTDKGNGEVDITNYKASLNDYVNLAAGLVVAGTQIAAGTEQIKNAQADAKSLSPLKAKGALNSVSYSTEALKLAGEEVAFQTKLVKNLIATIKSSGNN